MKASASALVVALGLAACSGGSGSSSGSDGNDGVNVTSSADDVSLVATDDEGITTDDASTDEPSTPNVENVVLRGDNVFAQGESIFVTSDGREIRRGGERLVTREEARAIAATFADRADEVAAANADRTATPEGRPLSDEASYRGQATFRRDGEVVLRSDVDLDADFRPGRSSLRGTLGEFISEDLDGQVIDGGFATVQNGIIDPNDLTVSGDLSGELAGSDGPVDVTGTIDGGFIGEAAEGIEGNLVLRPEGGDALEGDYIADQP